MSPPSGLLPQGRTGAFSPWAVDVVRFSALKMLPDSQPGAQGQLEAGTQEADMVVVMCPRKPAAKAPGSAVLQEPWRFIILILTVWVGFVDRLQNREKEKEEEKRQTVNYNSNLWANVEHTCTVISAPNKYIPVTYEAVTILPLMISALSCCCYYYCTCLVMQGKNQYWVFWFF